MTSGLTGVAKIGGRLIFPIGFPSRLKIFAVFLTIVFTVYFPWGDSRDICVICGGSSAMCFGGRAG